MIHTHVSLVMAIHGHPWPSAWQTTGYEYRHADSHGAYGAHGAHRAPERGAHEAGNPRKLKTSLFFQRWSLDIVITVISMLFFSPALNFCFYSCIVWVVGKQSINIKLPADEWHRFVQGRALEDRFFLMPYDGYFSKDGDQSANLNGIFWVQHG